MKALTRYNPLVLFLWFLSCALITMFCMNPVICSASFIFGVLMLLLIQGYKRPLKKIIGYILLIAVLTITNPIFSHRGFTVLFYVNNNPVTSQALIYGFFSGVMISAVLIWFDIINYTVSLDSMLYITGYFFPKISLLFSFTLKLIPEYILLSRNISECNTTLGFDNKTVLGKIKSIRRTFSSMLEALPEQAADSALMISSRGFSSGKRTAFFPNKIKSRDIVLFCLLSFLLVFSIIACNTCRFYYYPLFLFDSSLLLLFPVLMIMLPAFIVIIDNILWKIKCNGCIENETVSH